MKKIFTLMIIAASLMALPANAQKFGLKAGLNVTNMSLSSKVLDADNQCGFFVGPTVKFSLPLVGLGVDVAALYDQRSAKVEYEGTNATITSSESMKTQSIQIPINLRYNIGLGSNLSAFLFAGPQFGFNIGDKEKKLKLADWKLKTSNFSVNVGLGITIMQHLQVSANYNIACGTTGEITGKDVFNGLKNKAKANAWQIATAYYF